MGNLKDGKTEAKVPNIKPVAAVVLIGLVLTGLLLWALGVFDSKPAAATGETTGGLPVAPPGDPDVPALGPSQCVGRFVTACNIHSDGRNLTRCDKRYTKDETNSSTDYLQCMLSTNGAACNKWNNSDKSDIVECIVPSPALCEGSPTWHGEPGGARNTQNFLARDVERMQCKCPNEPDGYIPQPAATGGRTDDVTQFHTGDMRWKCADAEVGE
tara:strand:- start:7388 stop:8029 length:642 start_codon:yes stop_codon:yes gene_type:complete